MLSEEENLFLISQAPASDDGVRLPSKNWPHDLCRRRSDDHGDVLPKCDWTKKEGVIVIRFSTETNICHDCTNAGLAELKIDHPILSC